MSASNRPGRGAKKTPSRAARRSAPVHRDGESDGRRPVELSRQWSRSAAIHAGQNRSAFQETSEALYLTSGYVYSSAEEAAAAFAGDVDRYIYSRFGNPTVRMFERKLALLEGAEDCWATATGMAAVFAALMCQLKTGDRLVAARALFGSCDYIISEILPRFGVETILVDGRDEDAWKRALSVPTKLVFLESPSNPTLDIVDIGTVSDLAHKAGAKVVVDNVFATPFLQKPLAFGADIVVYSATKHIDGQGRCLGGAVLGDRHFCTEVLKPFIRNTGPSMSPFNAWVMVKSLETLEWRVRAGCDNALRIARFLEDHDAVGSVLYPELDSFPQKERAMRQMRHGGTIVTFRMAADNGGNTGEKDDPGKKKAFAFLNALEIIRISNNLGDTRSLATHPSTTTHHRLDAKKRKILGIEDDMIRISAGLEDGDDLIGDIDRALAQSTACC